MGLVFKLHFPISFWCHCYPFLFIKYWLNNHIFFLKRPIFCPEFYLKHFHELKSFIPYVSSPQNIFYAFPAFVHYINEIILHVFRYLCFLLTVGTWDSAMLLCAIVIYSVSLSLYDSTTIYFSIDGLLGCFQICYCKYSVINLDIFVAHLYKNSSRVYSRVKIAGS